jgi:hypothetical protein
VTPVSYYAPDEFSSPKFAFAFARGCDGEITDETELFPGPVALFGTPSRWDVLRQAQSEGREWYYGDHGYLGRRTYYRITKNAYQHDGRGAATPDRWRKFNREILPWRKDGSHVLVCPNSATYCALHGFDVQDWLTDVHITLRAHTDREIRLRWKVDRTPIGFDLVDCWACVVFSSAAALEALIFGVPIFVLAPFAAGARLGLSDLTKIEAPIYPDGREQLLWNLCDQQWTLQEIFKGDAWRALREC